MKTQHDIICKEGNSLFQFVFSRHNSLNNRTEEQRSVSVCTSWLVKKTTQLNSRQTASSNTRWYCISFHLYFFALEINTEEFIKSTTNRYDSVRLLCRETSCLPHFEQAVDENSNPEPDVTVMAMSNILRQCRCKKEKKKDHHNHN